MSVKIRHVFTYIGDPEIQGKRMSRELTKAMKAAVKKHGSRSVARRFTPGGARELKYKRRSQEYQSDKAVTKGHRNPYEWSGDMKREAKAGAKFSATKKQIIIRIPLEAFALAGLRRKRIDAKREMATVSSAELNAYAKTVRDNLVANLNAIRTRRTKRV